MGKIFANPTFRFLLLIAFFVGVFILGKTLHFDIDKTRAWLSQYPIWISGLIFVVIYVGLTTLLWVGTIDFFRTTAAILFGPYLSTVLVYIAELCNASILFMLSRKLGWGFVRQHFQVNKSEIQRTTRNTGFWWAFALRTNPLVPFRFMDLGFGLTKLPFKKYFLAIVLGSPVRIFWLQFIIGGVGEALFKDKAALLSYLQEHSNVLMLSLVYFVAVAVITIIAICVSTPRKPATPPV
jgi:uncharacterized membrane protein YdjX (TVP38/TMEM64 family)